MRVRSLIALFAAVLLLAACSTPKRHAYIADADRDVQTPITNFRQTAIFPEDVLHIYVYSQKPAAVVPFNQETNTGADNAKPTGYLVSTNGDITFPFLGRVSTTGHTLESLAREIEKQLIEKQYVNDPVVTVSLMNFRVTVIGEVRYPRQIHADGERITVFEALAQCGDVTKDGIRECVTIIRTNGNEQIVDTLDLTRREVLNSPYYYLQQNDILYVEPTKKRKRTAYRNEDWPHYLSTGVAAVRMAYLAVYRIVRAENVR